MVAALEAFYDATGGNAGKWLNKTDWITGGEPCISGWHGVGCCLASHPIIVNIGGSFLCKSEPGSASSRRARRRLLRLTSTCVGSFGNPDAELVPMITPQTKHCCAVVQHDDALGPPHASHDPPPCDVTGGCYTVDDAGSGEDAWYSNPTTTVASWARCVVTTLELPNNGLNGTLDTPALKRIEADLLQADRTSTKAPRFFLDFLQYIDFSTPVDPSSDPEIQAGDAKPNSLSGPLPKWMFSLPNLQAVNFMGNAFTYDDEAVETLEKTLRSSCEKVGANSIARTMNAGQCFPMGKIWDGFSREFCFSFSDAHVPRPGYNLCFDCQHTAGLIAAYTWAVVAGYLVLLAVPAVVLLHRIARRAEYAYQGGGLKRELAAAAVVAFHLQVSVTITCINARVETAPALPFILRRAAACLVLDPVCVAEPLCFSDTSIALTRALGAHYASTTYVAWVLSIPPLLLFAAVGLRMLARKLKWARASRVGAEVELSMTILHALLHAPASRVIRQLLSPLSAKEVASLEGGTDSNLIGLGTEAWFDASGNYIPVGIGAGANAFGVMAGVTLLVLHIAVIARYAYSLSATVQARKKDGGYAMKLRFVSGQYRTKGSAALWNVALGVLHLALLGATAVYTMDSGVPWGSILLIAVLAAGWAAHSYIEPYEYSFLNDVSSRLWLSQMLFVVLILCWGALFQGTYILALAIVLEVLLWTSFVGFSALSPLVLFRGLRNSARAAAGVATDSVPIWLYGAHWVELPLPPGAVAVLGIHPAPPPADDVFDALHNPEQKSFFNPAGLRRRKTKKPKAEKKKEKKKGGFFGKKKKGGDGAGDGDGDAAAGARRGRRLGAGGGGVSTSTRRGRRATRDVFTSRTTR